MVFLSSLIPLVLSVIQGLEVKVSTNSTVPLKVEVTATTTVTTSSPFSNIDRSFKALQELYLVCKCNCF